MSFPKNEQVIFVLSDDELKESTTSYGIWYAIRAMRQLVPRRKFPIRIYEAISEYKGKILNLDGSMYAIPEDQEIFGNDTDFRWLDNCYLALNNEGERLYLHCKNLERVRLLDLYLQIAFPMSIARHYR